MKKNQFGNSKACFVLAELLENYDKYNRRKISMFLHQSAFKFKYINNLEDIKIRSYIFNLVLRDMLLQIEQKKIDLELKNYIKNVVKYQYRRCLNGSF